MGRNVVHARITMKIITIQEALDLLHKSMAVAIGDTITRANPDLITGDADNTFASIDDPANSEYSIHSFTEGDNQAPSLEGSLLILRDDSGEDCEITLLCPMGSAHSVWTCTISNRAGESVTVHETEKGALAEVYGYVKEQWASECVGDIPEDHDEATRAYFEIVNGLESANVEKVTIMA